MLKFKSNPFILFLLCSLSFSVTAGAPGTDEPITLPNSDDYSGKIVFNEISNIGAGAIELFVNTDESITFTNVSIFGWGHGNIQTVVPFCDENGNLQDGWNYYPDPGTDSVAKSTCSFKQSSLLIYDSQAMHNQHQELLIAEIDSNIASVPISIIQYVFYDPCVKNENNNCGKDNEIEPVNNDNVSRVEPPQNGKTLCAKPDGSTNWSNDCDSTLNDYNDADKSAFIITHDGEGSNCAIETVDIQAFTDNTYSRLVTDSLSVDLLLNGVVVKENIVVTNGAASVEFNYRTLGIAEFSVQVTGFASTSDLVCVDGDEDSCLMAFSNSGCGLNQICPVPFDIDGLTSYVDGGEIKFKDNGQLLYNSDANLITDSINDGDSDTLTCVYTLDGQNINCETSDEEVNLPVGFLPSFQTTSSSVDLTVTDEDGLFDRADMVLTAVNSELNSLNIEEGAIVDFITDLSDTSVAANFRITHLNLDKNVTLNLSAGNYWIEHFNTKKGNNDSGMDEDAKNLTINLIGEGEVNLYLFNSSEDDKIKFQDGTTINQSHTYARNVSPSNLNIFTWEKLEIKDNNTISAMIYSDDDFKIEGDSQLFGAASASKLEIKDDAKVYYQCNEESPITPVGPPVAQCSIHFVDGVTNHPNGDKTEIKFGKQAALFYNPDNTLATSKLNNDSELVTCQAIGGDNSDNQNCIEDVDLSVVTGLVLNDSNFVNITGNNNPVVTLNSGSSASERQLGVGEYQSISIEQNTTVNFSSNGASDQFVIDELNLAANVTLNFEPGHYWIKKLNLKTKESDLSLDANNLIINRLGNEVVNLYLYGKGDKADTHLDFLTGSRINYDATSTDAENARLANLFHIYAWGKLHFKDDVRVAALMYAQDEFNIGDKKGGTSFAYGAASSNKVELKEDSKLYYGCEKIVENLNLYKISFVDSPTLTCEGLAVEIRACKDRDSCTEYVDIEATDLRIISSASTSQFPVSLTTISGLTIGQATVYQATSGVTKLSLVGQDDNCDPEGCPAEFVSTLLKLSQNGNDDLTSVCGPERSYTLEALEDGGDGECISLFTDSSVIPVNFTSSVASLKVNGETLSQELQETVDVTFNNGDGAVDIQFNDVGVHQLSFNLTRDLPNTDDLYVAGSSTLKFFPAGFDVSTNMVATHVAGEPFTTTVAAVCEHPTDTSLIGTVAPSYQPEDDKIDLTLTKGSGDYRLGRFYLESDISNMANAEQIEAQVNFENGQYQTTESRYLEVGDLTITVADTYLDEPIAGEVTLSRFIPDHFKVSVIDEGEIISRTCNMLTGSANFTYTGQLLSDEGDINYFVAPTFKATPYAYRLENEAEQITQNYIDRNTQVNLTATSKNSVSLLANLSSSEGLVFTQNDDDRGELFFEFSMNDHFYYQRNFASQIAPFNAVFDMQIAGLRDSDGVGFSQCAVDDEFCVCDSGECEQHFDLQGDSSMGSDVVVKFGRWFIVSDTKGQDEDLPIEMQLQYFDGSNFVVNQTTATNNGDSCTNIDGALLELKDIEELTTSDTQIEEYNVGVNKFFSEGKSNDFYLTAPNKSGAIGVKYLAPTWLQYPWNSDSNYDTDANPLATMVFGIFSDSSQRIINQREIEGKN